MCGIVGLWRFQGADADDPLRLRAMADVIAHRGPDDHGYLCLDSSNGRHAMDRAAAPAFPCDVFLGSRRLAIIDLSADGRQPMANETNDVFVVFNGEIFNYIELRRELESFGHVFRSRADTEVIVHAYEEWGEDCARRFNGMWGYAIWDQRRRRLVCSRDRFGVKPFFCHESGGAFFFASEVKSILAALDQTPAPDEGVLAGYLAYAWLRRTGRTFFSGVHALEPAHNWIVTASGIEKKRYWSYTDQSECYDYANAEETFRGLLSDSVRLRLRSDAPLGLLLSGGLDSTSVAAFASEHTGGAPLHAFTAIFPGYARNERHHAELVARQFGMQFHPVEFQSEWLLDDLDQIVRHMDGPTRNAQTLPRWRLLNEIRHHVKVVLEGQGADEILAGYVEAYFAPYALDELAAMRPGRVTATLRRIAEAWKTSKKSAPGPPPWISLIKAILGISRWRYFRPSAADRALTVDTRRMAGRIAREPRPEPLFPDRLTNALLYDHSVGKLPHLLDYGDAISMSHSIEARVPFMDYRLVEFVFGLPFREKFNGRYSKHILRRAMADRLPPSILSRTDKIGFATPVGEWMLKEMNAQVRPLLQSPEALGRGYFDPEKLDDALTRFSQGDRILSHSVFRWLCAELWHRRYYDGNECGKWRAMSRPAANSVQL